MNPAKTVCVLVDDQSFDPSLNQKYPGLKDAFAHAVSNFKDSPHLCGMVCVALATGVAKDVLRGKYLDAQQDLGDILNQRDAMRSDPALYTLHTRFLGDLQNDGGTEKMDPEPRYDFPGV